MKECFKLWCKQNYKSHPAMKRWGANCMLSKSSPCKLEEIAIHSNVINVLDRPIKDGIPFINELTSEELEYCLNTETRKSMQSKLRDRSEELCTILKSNV